MKIVQNIKVEVSTIAVRNSCLVIGCVMVLITIRFAIHRKRRNLYIQCILNLPGNKEVMKNYRVLAEWTRKTVFTFFRQKISYLFITEYFA